ncbi:MAG: hypothetical protein EOP68_21825, partial [Sphingomonas sp.]
MNRRHFIAGGTAASALALSPLARAAAQTAAPAAPGDAALLRDAIGLGRRVDAKAFGGEDPLIGGVEHDVAVDRS